MQQVELEAAQRLLISYLNLLFSVKIVYNYRLIKKKSSSQILTLWLGDIIDYSIRLSTLPPSLSIRIWPQDSHSMGDSEVSFIGDVINMCAADDVIPNNFMINTVFFTVENTLFCSILRLITSTLKPERRCVTRWKFCLKAFIILKQDFCICTDGVKIFKQLTAMMFNYKLFACFYEITY